MCQLVTATKHCGQITSCCSEDEWASHSYMILKSYRFLCKFNVVSIYDLSVPGSFNVSTLLYWHKMCSKISNMVNENSIHSALACTYCPKLTCIILESNVLYLVQTAQVSSFCGS